MVHTIDLYFSNVPQVIAAYLVETKAGPILIETGPYSTFERLVDGIKDIGYQPEEIGHVLLTHIHLDHAGAAWAFAEMGANIYVHPAGYEHLLDPSRLIASAKRIYKDKMDELWGAFRPIPAAQLIKVKDKAALTFGKERFISHYTPGHAVHHIAWEFDGHLFAGDVAGICIEQGAVYPPCPPPDIHVEHWQNSLSRIKELDLQAIHLAHFGTVTAISKHLDRLEDRLLDWAAWIRREMDHQRDMETMVPLFAAYVAQQLREEEISEMGVKKYEAANPAWMSVAGLMRYWHKKLTSE